jgi:ADP-ribose pyrophosphatase
MRDATRLGRRSVYRGRIVALSVDRVRLPNGKVVELECVGHPGAAAVVPVDRDRNVVLVRQYRYCAGGLVLEVPAGTLDPGEDPARCAEREVEEETGYRVGRLVPMGWIWTTPGFTDERIWLFLASELEETPSQLQADEVLTVERLPLERAVEMASRGEIRDAKSVCALLRAPHYLERP